MVSLDTKLSSIDPRLMITPSRNRAPKKNYREVFLQNTPTNDPNFDERLACNNFYKTPKILKIHKDGTCEIFTQFRRIKSLFLEA